MASRCASGSVFATWAGSNSNWATATNWSTNPNIPGQTGGSTTAGDSATFQNASASSPVTLDQDRNLKTIQFINGSTRAYVINAAAGAHFLLTSGGSIIDNIQQMTGTTETVSAPLVLEPASGTTNGTFTFTTTANNIAGNSLIISGAISGGTTTGTIALSLAGTNSTATNQITGSIGNGTSAGVSLTKTGVSLWQLSNTSNSYSGGTTVNQGTLSSNVANGFGTGAITVDPTGTAGTAADGATLNTNGSIASTAAVTVNKYSATAVGTVNFNDATPVIGSLTGTGNVVLNKSSGTGLTTGNATSTKFAGVISDLGTNNGSLTVAGTGTFTLTNANTYGGSTTINSSATLALGDGTTDGSIANTSGVTDNGALIFNCANSDRAPAYAISGSGSVTLNGSKTLTFAATNTYNGTTTVNGGTLSITGKHIGGGAYSVNNTATLAGTGTIINTGGIAIGSSATLYPGVSGETSTGSLHAASVSFNNGGNFAIRVNSDTGTADELVTTGPVVLGDGTTSFALLLVTNDLGNTTMSLGTHIPIIVTTTDGSGGISGIFSNSSLTVGNNTYAVSYFGNDTNGNHTEVDLTVTAVPEPASFGLLGLGGVAMVRRRRREMSNLG